MRYTIGLDIGIASVGWAVINEDKHRIENLGVRLFKKAEETDGKSLNLVRREARGTRRRIRRRATRMQKVKELFFKYGLVSEDELESLYFLSNADKDVYELRAEGLDRILNGKEFARVLTNIAKRRGYKSNRKTDEEDKETGKLTQGTKKNNELLEEKGYRTIGEMFYKDEKFKANKRNKGGEYNNSVLRKMLINEVQLLFECQRNFKSKFASKEFEKEYYEIVEYQKPYLTEVLLNKMLGNCTFEKEEHRAPKNSYTFERFTLLQKVNNLRIDIGGKKLEVSQIKKEEIVKLAYEQTEIKYTQLRKKLELPIEARFIDLNYNNLKNKKELSEEEIIKKIEDKKFIKLEGWHKIRKALKDNGNEKSFQKIKQNPELQNIIADALVRNKTDEDIERYLQERKIDEDLITSMLKINFTKFGHLSYKAMKKIIPELEKGLTYDKACENAGYDFKGNKGVSHYKLPLISKTEDIILNPVVLRSVSETRKVVNAIIDKYGSPMSINIETARELSKSFNERQEIDRKQQENAKYNEKIIKEIKEQFEIDAKPIDIVKMKLWKEQNGRCPYSDTPIPADRLFEENFVQIDHIIPFSRCFDDSYQNKVLVLATENQRKQEKTPFEYFGQNEEKWHKFVEFVNITYKYNIKKKANFLIQELNEVEENKWIDRNINDTRYIARFMLNYISNNLKFAESENKVKVHSINGQTTAVLRHFWGIQKNREESDKHHALDAVVIACANSKNIKKVSDYSRKKNLYINSKGEETEYNKNIKIELPWPEFRDELLARLENGDNNSQLYSLINGKFYNYDDIEVEKIKPIFVSRKPERKVKGKAHKDTLYSQKFIRQGFNFKTVKKPLKSISKTEITDIISNPNFRQLYMSDKAVYDDIYERMKEADFKAEKAFSNEYRKHSKNGNGPIVRSITIPVSGGTGVELKKNKSIAENDTMVRVDVFEKDKKFYLVPIYVADFVKKQLPNKAIVASKDENEWIEMTEEYKFKFSLYKNDLVKVKRKNEKELITYYNGTHRGTAGIKLLKDPNVMVNDKDYETYGSKTLQIFEKYQVDILGNIYKVNKEERSK